MCRVPDATSAQLEANDHSGHCHALGRHPTSQIADLVTVVCHRPRNHTGMHSNCGTRPGAHTMGDSTCLLWYGAGAQAIAMQHDA
jgi:hypothetical protein